METCGGEVMSGSFLDGAVDVDEPLVEQQPGGFLDGVSSDDDVADDVAAKIARNDGGFTLDEYSVWREREDQKDFLAKGGELLEGIGEGISSLAKTAVEAAEEIGQVQSAPREGIIQNAPIVGDIVRLAPTASESVLQWMSQLGTTGQNIAEGTAGRFRDDGLAGDYERLRNKLQRNLAASPGDESTITGDLTSVALQAAGASPEAAERVRAEVSDQVLPAAAEIGSLAPDFAIAGGASRLLRGSKLANRASQVSNRLVKAMGAPSLKLARKLDDTIQTALSKKNVATFGSVGAGVGLGSGNVKLEDVAQTAGLVIGAKLGYGALRGAGRMGAKALKAKVEHGIFGKGQLTVWDNIARNSQQPLWARRAAMTAAAIQRSRGAALAGAATSGAAIEGLQEGFETFLTQDATAREIGQGVGAGALIGGLAGAAYSKGGADDYLSDLDAIRYRDVSSQRGDNVAYFDSLPDATRRQVTDAQAFLGDVATVRLADTATIEAQAGQALPLAKGVFMDRESKVVFLNTDILSPKKVAGVLAHEAGHAVYHALPEPVKRSWRQIARDNWSQKEIETFKTAYEEKLGARISDETAFDELFAEQFLGQTVGKGALRRKRALNRSGRVLTMLKAKMLDAMGIDPRGRPSDLFEFTPFSNAPALRSFVDQAIADLDLYAKQAKPVQLPEGGKVDPESPEVALVANAIDSPDQFELELSNGEKVIPVTVTSKGQVGYTTHAEVAKTVLTSPDDVAFAESTERAIEEILAATKAGEETAVPIHEASLDAFAGVTQAQIDAETVAGVRDASLVSQVRNLGKIMSKGKAEQRIRQQLKASRGGLFDERDVQDRLSRLYPEDAKGLSQLFSDQASIMPDEAADYLGVDVADIFQAARDEIGLARSVDDTLRDTRDEMSAGEAALIAKESKQLDRFQAALQASEGEAVLAKELGDIGETVIIDGTETTITAKDDRFVTLDGGERFGAQDVSNNQTVRIEGRGDFVDIAFSPGDGVSSIADEDFFDGVVRFSPGDENSSDKRMAIIPDGHPLLPAGQVRRKRLQKAILDSVPLSPTTNERPTLTFLGGGGGAGKSTVLGQLNNVEGTPLDVDDLRSFIPEYSDESIPVEKRAPVTHKEASKIGKDVFLKGIRMKADMIKDGVLGNPESAAKQVKEAREAGYDVRLIAVTIDPATALERAQLRAKQTGRHVPEDVLLEAHQNFNAALAERYRSLFEPGEIEVYDNSGDAPELIAPLDARIRAHSEKARALLVERKATAERKAEQERQAQAQQAIAASESLLAELEEAYGVKGIDALKARRDEARAQRDFATSDAIRDGLAALGVAIRDGAVGG